KPGSANINILPTYLMLSYPTLHMKRLNILPSNDKQRKLKPCLFTISSMMIFRGNICCKCDLYLIKKYFHRLFRYKIDLYLNEKRFIRLFTYKIDLYLIKKYFHRLFTYKIDLYLNGKRFIRLFTYKIDLYLIKKHFHRLFRYKTNAPNVSMIRSDSNTVIGITSFPLLLKGKKASHHPWKPCHTIDNIANMNV